MPWLYWHSNTPDSTVYDRFKWASNFRCSISMAGCCFDHYVRNQSKTKAKKVYVRNEAIKGQVHERACLMIQQESVAMQGPLWWLF